MSYTGAIYTPWRGRFLCRFDADDVMFEERVERQVALLRHLQLGGNGAIPWKSSILRWV